MFVKEAAVLWNLTERRVAALCKDGKIQGAKKDGKSWIIPTGRKKDFLFLLVFQITKKS